MAGEQTAVYRKQGATELVIDNGGYLNAASGSISLPTNLRRGFYNFDLHSARALSSAENYLGASVSATGGNLGNAIGGLLNANSTPSLTNLSTAGRMAVLTWASGNNTEIALGQLGVPPDLNTATGITIHALAERASDNASDNTLDFRFWSGTGTTEMGTTGATLTTAFTEISISVGATAIAGGHPGVWNFGLAPTAHNNNAVRVAAAWVEWDRRTS